MNATTAYAASLYQAGFSCDGHPIAECFYVLMEHAADNAIFNAN
jgi:hypothetical protein